MSRRTPLHTAQTAHCVSAAVSHEELWLVCSVRCEPSPCGTLGAMKLDEAQEKKKRLDFIFLFRFYFYFLGIVNGLCQWHIICIYYMYIWHIICIYTHMLACECMLSCPTLCDPMDCSLPGTSVHGIFPG